MFKMKSCEITFRVYYLVSLCSRSMGGLDLRVFDFESDKFILQESFFSVYYECVAGVLRMTWQRTPSHWGVFPKHLASFCENSRCVTGGSLPTGRSQTSFQSRSSHST
jgi:hypothetical protein